MSIYKTGIWTSPRITNYFLNYVITPNIIKEPDGSMWIQIFHHNNPTDNLFSSSDPFTKGVYKNENMWFNFNICNQFTSWELLVKQKPASTSAESKFRWIQNANPMTCAFGDVDYADVTHITTSGYITPSSSFGGLYKKGGICWLCQNNSNSGNWWGAIGSWSAYQGGIPGWNGQLATSGYIDIYIRIDNNSLKEETITKIKKNQELISNGFFEI